MGQEGREEGRKEGRKEPRSPLAQGRGQRAPVADGCNLRFIYRMLMPTNNGFPEIDPNFHVFTCAPCRNLPQSAAAAGGIDGV